MYRFRYSSILLFVFILWPVAARAAIVAPNQASWLASHNNTLIVRPEKSYPPFSFISSDPGSRPKGLAVDYIELVAKKVGAHVTYLDAKPRSSILADLKAGKEGIMLALSETADEESNFYFSEPFASIPVVIVTRKDFKHSKDLTLADFNGKEVAIADGYTAMEYVTSNYQKIIIDPVSDDEVGLQKLLLGEVDAAVMDMASLSYYTSRDMLSYVTIAGQTGFEYKVSFAVPKTMPDLAVILNAGLKEITPTEQQIIKDRWVTFENPQDEKRGFSALFFTGGAVWIGLSILGGIIILILLTSMIVHTRRHHALHIASVARAKAKEQTFSKLTGELQELEEASAVLNQNMQEIQSLEKTIKEKIEHINN